MSKFGTVIGVVCGTLGAATTAAGGVYVKDNKDVVKDYIKGNEVYTSQQMTDVKTDYQGKIDKVIADFNLDLETKVTENEELQNELKFSNQQISELENKVNSYESKLENYIFVSYMVDGVETTQIQDKNSTVDFADPIKEGFVFNGWSLTENGDIVDGDISFDRDTTLYAVFEEVSLITFTVNHDGNIETFQAVEGMTFGAWVNSEYNTAGYLIVDMSGMQNLGPATITDSSEYRVVTEDGLKGLQSDVVIKDIEYTLVSTC